MATSDTNTPLAAPTLDPVVPAPSYGAALHLASSVRAIDYPGVVADKIWTATELEKLTPAQRSQIFRDSIVDDLEDVPSEFLDRVKSRLADHVKHTEVAGTA